MTRRLLAILFLAGGMCAAILATPASSQVIPAAPKPKQPSEPENGKVKKTPTGCVLNNESLAEMLDSMGYDFQTQTLPSGYVLYNMTIPGTFEVTFVGEDTMQLRGSGLSIPYKRQ